LNGNSFFGLGLHDVASEFNQENKRPPPGVKAERDERDHIFLETASARVVVVAGFIAAAGCGNKPAACQIIAGG
jgi:hypothetical protein